MRPKGAVHRVGFGPPGVAWAACACRSPGSITDLWLLQFLGEPEHWFLVSAGLSRTKRIGRAVRPEGTPRIRTRAGI